MRFGTASLWHLTYGEHSFSDGFVGCGMLGEIKFTYVVEGTAGVIVMCL
jgi:hypothetical protein